MRHSTRYNTRLRDTHDSCAKTQINKTIFKTFAENWTGRMFECYGLTAESQKQSINILSDQSKVWLVGATPPSTCNVVLRSLLQSQIFRVFSRVSLHMLPQFFTINLCKLRVSLTFLKNSSSAILWVYISFVIHQTPLLFRVQVLQPYKATIQTYTCRSLFLTLRLIFRDVR